ncbi:MAG: glycosyltransferase family 39 protein [Elusimicrobia bacterium]|nr:glycosyltransferase family 39 protein [Elusimicrobiota bacterium]
MTLPAIAQSPLHLGMWFIAISGSMAVGGKILRLFHMDDAGIEPVLGPASLALGLSAVGFGVLAVGQMGHLSPRSLWTLFGLLAALTFIERQPLKEFFLMGLLRFLRNDKEKKPLTLLLRLAAAAIALLFFLNAYRPEIFFDTLVYHLGLPAIFLSEGRTNPLPWHFFSAMPLLTEMISTLGLGIGGEPWAKMLSSTLGLIAPWTLWSWGQKLGRPRVGLLAGLLFLTTPIIGRNLFNGLNEPALAGFLMLALYFGFSNFHDSKPDAQSPSLGDKTQNSKLFLSGLFGGLCFGVKYLGGLWCLILLLTIIIMEIARQTRQERPLIKKGSTLLTKIILFSAGVLIAASPWMIRSWAALGDPLYPYLSIWRGHYSNPEGWAHFQWEVRHWQTNWPRLLGGLVVILKGSFWDTSSTYFMGPAYLVLLALCGNSLIKNRIAGLGLFAIMSWTVGLWQTHYLRYLSPLLAPVALGALWSVDRMASEKRRLWAKRIAGFFIALHIAWMMHSFRRRLDQKAIFGLLAPAQYRQAKLGYWNAVEWINRNAGPEDRILILGDTRSYGFKRRLVVSTVHDIHPLSHWIAQSKTPQELKTKLAAQDARYIFHNRVEEKRIAGYGMMRLDPDGKKLWDNFKTQFLEAAFTDETVTIYRIRN